MNKDQRKSRILELLIIVIIMSAVVFGITIGLGTMTSGWHFVDDHEFLEYEYRFRIKGDSFLDVLTTEMRMNLYTRLRLLHYPARVLTGYFIGANSIFLSVLKAIDTITCLVLLYYIAREMDISKTISVFFALLSMTGYQSALWWKLGAEHLKAEICFLISMLLLIKYLKGGKRHNAIWSLLFAMLMCGFHESFILLCPFMALFSFLDAVDFSGATNARARELFFKTKEGNCLYSIAILVLFVLNIGAILLLLGINSYPAVGTAGGLITTIKQYVVSFDYSIHNDLRWYYILGLLLVGILLTYYEQLKRIWVYILLAALYMLPQFVLYGKEGLAERYLIPVIIGYALFFVVWIERSGILTGMRKKIYIAILVVMLLANSFAVVVEADYFRFRGQSVTKTLEVIETLEDKGYTVMSCFGNANPEADWTVEMYMRSKGKDNVLYWDQYASEVIDVRPWIRGNDAQVFELNDVDVIVAYNRDDRHFELEPNMDLSGFECIKCGSIDIFCREDSSELLNLEILQDVGIKPTLFGIGE